MLMTNLAYKDETSKFDIPYNADFDVGLRPIFNINHKPIPKRKEVFRKDTNEGLAVVSDTYKVRSYKEAMMMVKDLILGSGIDTRDVEVKHTIDNNGAVYMCRWTFNRIKGIQMFNDPKERSVFQIEFRSSHNMRFPEELIVWATYLWCNNGCATSDWSLHVRTKHNTTKDVKIDYSRINEAVELFLQGEEEKKTWLKQDTELTQVKRLFQQTLAFSPKDSHEYKWYSENQMEDLIKLYKKYSDRYGENKFAVFQTATDWSTHFETKGRIYNVQNKRNSRVQEMLAHELFQ